MSVEAITWAMKEPVAHSSAKFVLVVLANCASADTFEAYPSGAYIVEATGQDRKTVQANIQRLLELGHITDTGERKGRTKQVIVYRLNCPGFGPVKEAQKRDGLKRPVFPPKEARFSPERGPKTGHGTQRKLKEPNTPLPPDGGEPGFDEIAAGYPRQADIEKARRVWDRLAPSVQLQGEIAQAIRAWIRSPEWRRDEGRYIPKFSNWLRGERWRDVPGFTAPAPVERPPPEVRAPAVPMPSDVRAKVDAILGRRAGKVVAHGPD